MANKITKPTDAVFPGFLLENSLTKRELFTLAALISTADMDMDIADIAKNAVKIADETIKALNENQ